MGDDTNSAIPRLKRLELMADRMMRGCTSKTQLAAAFGISPQTAAKDMRNILRGLTRESSLAIRAKLRYRVEQLMAVAYEARVGHDRSRQPQRETKTVSKPCGVCFGQGGLEVAPGGDEDEETHWRDCPACRGLGQVSETTVRVVERTGAPAYLEVARKCVAEAAKLEGLYPRGVDDPARSADYRLTINQVHNELNVADGGENPFAKAPPELLVAAKAALAAVVESQAPPPAVIDVEAEPSAGGSG